MKTYLKLVAVFFTFVACLVLFGQDTNATVSTNSGPVTASESPAAKDVLGLPSELILPMMILPLMKAIKASPIANWLIPYFTFILGALGFCALNGWTVRNAIIGMVLGGGATGIHQAYAAPAQARQDNAGETKFMEKKDVKPKDE